MEHGGNSMGAHNLGGGSKMDDMGLDSVDKLGDGSGVCKLGMDKNLCNLLCFRRSLVFPSSERFELDSVPFAQRSHS